MVIRRRGRPDSCMIRYPNHLLHPLRLERLRRMEDQPRLSPKSIGRRRLVLTLTAWLLFLTGLFFVVF